jgi:menaquinone-dependent protoporphyrinogen IX oxidase
MQHCGAMDAASPSILPPGRLLVAFATKHGSTGEIARTIGAGLAEVDVLLVEQVERIDNYRAVVVGSGVYMNRWLKPGTDFLKRFRRTLAARPIRLLSSGPAGGTETPTAASRPRRQACRRPRLRRASVSGWIGSALVAT